MTNLRLTAIAAAMLAACAAQAQTSYPPYAVLGFEALGYGDECYILASDSQGGSTLQSWTCAGPAPTPAEVGAAAAPAVAARCEGALRATADDLIFRPATAPDDGRYTDRDISLCGMAYPSAAYCAGLTAAVVARQGQLDAALAALHGWDTDAAWACQWSWTPIIEEAAP